MELISQENKYLQDCGAGITQEEKLWIMKLELFVNCFSKCTHQNIYALDYSRRGIVSMGNNLTYIYGVDERDYANITFDDITRLMIPSERRILKRVVGECIANDGLFPYSSKDDFSITFDYHLKVGQRSRLVHQILVPLFFSGDKAHRYFLCSTGISPNKDFGRILAYKELDDKFYEYDMKRDEWEQHDCVYLTDVEKDILRLSAQGYTIGQIAAELRKKENTVKSIKKSVFAKLGVSNISEAVAFVLGYRVW